MKRKCIIKGCEHDVYPQFEVDVEVCIYCSTEIPICQDCYESEDENIKKQIYELSNPTNLFPF